MKNKGGGEETHDTIKEGTQSKSLALNKQAYPHIHICTSVTVSTCAHVRTYIPQYQKSYSNSINPVFYIHYISSKYIMCVYIHIFVCVSAHIYMVIRIL